jgi:hypothetical protein
MNASDFQKVTTNLALQWSNDLSYGQISFEIAGFKQPEMSIICNIKSESCLHLLKVICELCLVKCYPNLEVASRIFLIMLVIGMP